MVSNRSLERSLSKEPAEIQFYLISEKEGKRLLKPIKAKGSLPLGHIRAILDKTISPSFFRKLSEDLINKGVEAGSKVQLRAKFSQNHTLYDQQLKGTKIICELEI